MKAARYYGKHDLRVEDIREPPALATGQVLVAPSYCGICGTDLHEYESGPIFVPRTRHPFSGAELPQILGHEFSGRVLAVGDGVVSVSPGQRVSIQPQIGPRHDFFGSRNLSFLGPMASVVGLSWPWGGMAEQAVVNDYNAIPMPDEISDQQGALVEPAAVAVHAIDRSGVQPGGTLLITGMGPIGALMVLAARAAGVSRIVVSEINPNRRRRIEALGLATAVLDPTQPGFADSVRAETPERVGVDAAVECAGDGRALQSCISLVRAQGTVVQVGLMGRPLEVTPFDWTLRDITIRGSLNYPLTIWPRIFEMMRAGLLPADQLVDAEIGIDAVVPKGFQALSDRGGAAMKILVAL